MKYLLQVPEREPITRSEFEQRLRQWLDNGSDERVGDTWRHGKKPWVWIKYLGNRYYLNADTTRSGVEAYLSMGGGNDSLAWTMVMNERGKPNKVAFGTDQAVLPGFFLFRKIS